ncbi:MAG: MerR family transcriptional regulator [Bellilinea sp.]
MKLDQSRLEYYITPEQATKQLGVDLDSIYQLADDGKLHAAVMTDGTVGVSQQSVNDLLPKEAQPEYQVNAGLQGVPISINEAGRKYKLNTSTLTRWMQRGLIHKLGKDSKTTYSRG